ncbi:Dehydrogenase/reductase SDR family member 11 [Hypsibius exemplaris]|uniref:Dehydrogenase/reductase SDR family member 11 n=1 Tax=Hypsibius exemplaris TaxID=2072580 RepID=A0A1W0WC26_HYPEX|nr:Dehydrogenase/reductase SDR family member 11 [Hypsibius exemplaris]
MTDLKGKVILITGASAGIGLAAAETLAKLGAKVVACARNIEKIQALNTTLGKDVEPILAVKCDMTKEQDVLALFKEVADKHGKLDVLINNAGANSAAATLLEGDLVDWKAMLDLNILGLTLSTREGVKLIESSGSKSGHIINLNSLAGHVVPKAPYGQFYSGTKHMVTALTEGLRKSVQSKNIRVTSLSPGRVETEFLGRALGKGQEAVAAEIYKKVKVLEAQDIADAIVYILTAPAHVNIDELTITPLLQEQL